MYVFFVQIQSKNNEMMRLNLFANTVNQLGASEKMKENQLVNREVDP